MKYPRTLAALALSLCLPAQAATTAPALQFNGSDGNWFNPANWSSGRVPGEGDRVELDGNDQVTIDPAYTGGQAVRIGELKVRGVAILQTLPGTILQTRDEILLDQGQILYRSSGSEGDTLIADGGVVVLNPTPQSKRTYVLKSSVTLQVGLGGREPAGLTKVGPGTLALSGGYGHYATVDSDVVVLGGPASRAAARIDRLPRVGLTLALHYGFRPVAGDSFRIIRAQRQLVGEFIGLPEGGLVGCTDDNVGLYISYAGGDGNDVVLSARDTAPTTCLLLPAVQKVREAAARSTTATTREHILLARQVGTP